ncbi:uncharacterized protein LOC102805393 [Saccoglossus kowalevskii]|uniref:Uncharacterized protein LOC102805393 n=1 Tax=Saccoglossus kowalevskii TaxID=10224 RepID=A0ABM0ML71_SACKO|nr:PREDICTED: uncharacterized protein LOC102805393 [Saccoglossus kowalevskii]
MYVMPGEDATLDCTIYNLGDSTDHATWVYEETSTIVANIYPTGTGNASPGYGVDTSTSNRYDLIVYDITLDGSDGEYDCYFSLDNNPDGEVGKLVVLDNVDSVDIVDLYDDQKVDIIAGETTQFTCKASDGNPAAELTWTIGDTNITEYSTYTTQVSDNNDKLHNCMSVLN